MTERRRASTLAGSAAWALIFVAASACSSPVTAADAGEDARPSADGSARKDGSPVHDATAPRDTGSNHDGQGSSHADAGSDAASAPDGLAPYSLLVTAPASGATISGFVTVTGFAPRMLNVEVWDPNDEHPPLARTTPAADGSFTAIVDTSDLPNGADAWTVWAWDAPAGGTPTHMASQPLPVTIANGPSSDGGADSSDGGAPTTPTPVGGPGGYTTLLVNDSFGTNKPGANITSATQLNPSTPYGLTGTGWDLWMKAYGESPGVSANVTMKDTFVSLAPTGSPAGFMVSHFEALPTATTSYYFELRAMTGRGTSSTTWPALWLFSGNESAADNAQSEIDVMETYTDLAFGTHESDAGLYVDYFESTSHHEPMSAILEGPFTTNTAPIDVTTSYNVYGCELTLSGGVVIWKIYFNGALTQTSPDGIAWASSPPAMIVGWNPGGGAETPAVLQLDYARVWSK